MDAEPQHGAAAEGLDPAGRTRNERVLRTIHEFARGMLEARTVDELLWDVVGRTIARLGFEDCVIYLVDEERACLVQRAAHGPKNPREHVILNRIELSFGEGIVGSVASTGKGVIVPDVRKDPRYFPDGQPRASEMAAPIMHEGVVLGVLDSESSDYDAYSEEDLEIFETIALMLATRIAAERARDRVEASLRQASFAAEEASRTKAAFLANVSHEVRTPLVAVLGVAEMLRGLVEGGAPHEVVLDHLQVIERSGQHLLSLINQLLDLSSDEQGRLRVAPEWTQPASLLHEIGDLFQAKASGRGLRFTVHSVGDLPDRFVTDPTRVRQILVNLVDNALKFTDEGLVDVVLRALPVSEGKRQRLQCIVTDTGIGIPEAQRERVFESFHQADTSLMRKHSGLGLGLAISRVLARRLGGDLRIQDREGPDTTFVLEIEELEFPVAEVVSRAEQPARAAGQLRLLLAEDNPDSRRLMSYRLESEGHEVCAVDDGELALEAMREAGGAFDAVLLDMQMPKRDGFEVARVLRQMGFDRPVIALTAHTFPGDREQCLAAGCSDYLAKPFDWAELFDRLGAAKSE
jgi:signal transduction histidine kinase/ActR/RegA family two-component response regulator